MKLIALPSLLLLSPTVVCRLSFDDTQKSPIDKVEDRTPVNGDHINVDRSDPNSSSANCNDRLNCATCMLGSNCYWWADTQFCEKGCGMRGCGASTCSAPMTCRKCLASGKSWSPYTKECVRNCSLAPADAPCITGKPSGCAAYDDESVLEVA